MMAPMMPQVVPTTSPTTACENGVDPCQKKLARNCSPRGDTKMTSQVQCRSAEVCRKLNLRSHLVFQKTLEYRGMFTKGVLIPVPTTCRSAALYSQIGRGHEPLAEKTLTIGLTGGSVP